MNKDTNHDDVQAVADDELALRTLLALPPKLDALTRGAAEMLLPLGGDRYVKLCDATWADLVAFRERLDRMLDSTSDA